MNAKIYPVLYTEGLPKGGPQTSHASTAGGTYALLLRALLKPPLLLPLLIYQLLLQSFDVLGSFLELLACLKVDFVAPLPEHQQPVHRRQVPADGHLFVLAMRLAQYKIQLLHVAVFRALKRTARP